MFSLIPEEKRNMQTQSLTQLIADELVLRQRAQVELSSRSEKIVQLIQDHCIIDSSKYMSREEWQDFCFQIIFSRTCHSNTPFSTYLNNLMPQLGFPLGYAHNKLSVYRGLSWKIK